MKNIVKLSVVALTTALIFSSCDDQIMEWQKDPSKGEVTGEELPLPLVEKIGRYEPLKTYTDFKLGTGIGMDLYMTNEDFKKLADSNFDEVTVGYAMKHGPMVQANGSINFTKVDAFMVKTKAAGLTVFGHTLVWHSNQNAGYLNSLIAPTIIPGSSGTNLLNLTPVKDASFTGWTKNNGAGITSAVNAGLATNTNAVKLISSASSSNAWDLQLNSPTLPIVAGHNYELSFYIKSDTEGKGRVSFSNALTNRYPSKDWYATGGTPSGSFATTSQWKQVKVKINATDFVLGSTGFAFSLDLGYLPNTTYYLDANTLSVVDLDASSTNVNLLANGKFDGNTTSWTLKNGATNALGLATAAEAFEGSGALKVINSTNNPEQYKTQIQSSFTSTTISDTKYTVSFMIKSDAAGSIRCSTMGTDAKYQNDVTTTTTWTPVTWEFTSTGTQTGLSLDLGKVAGTYYIDNIVVAPTNATPSGPTPSITIEKSATEKTALIGAAMEDWISKMVGHYKNDITAWDVVNEPVRESGALRDGTENGSNATDFFSWIKYLGKDYAVTAFKLARQYGNQSDILFINDYNLESSLSKCDGLIDYVKYIESKGAKVDGIGTQMHISYNSDKDKIVQMFQKLAASGKLIKVSELDVRLGTVSPTAELQAKQADMYQFVIDSYKKYIPVAQQYGITIWGISDNKNEHEYWLPNESPNLWDANYVRKHAYKGTADGLAGKDVSAGFTGLLQK